MYDERLVTPMRQELTRLGVEELRTPDEVDAEAQGRQGNHARRRELRVRLLRAQGASGGGKSRSSTTSRTT